MPSTPAAAASVGTKPAKGSKKDEEMTTKDMVKAAVKIAYR